jgi:hypothetical protein
VFRETRSLPFFTAKIIDRRNAESTFGAEPTVLAPGHIKRACGWGGPLYNSRYYLGRSSEGHAVHIRVMSAFGSSRGKRSSSFHFSKPRIPKRRKHPELGPWFWRLVTRSRPRGGALMFIICTKGGPKAPN